MNWALRYVEMLSVARLERRYRVSWIAPDGIVKCRYIPMVSGNFIVLPHLNLFLYGDDLYGIIVMQSLSLVSPHTSVWKFGCQPECIRGDSEFVCVGQISTKYYVSDNIVHIVSGKGDIIKIIMDGANPQVSIEHVYSCLTIDSERNIINCAPLSAPIILLPRREWQHIADRGLDNNIPRWVVRYMVAWDDKMLCVTDRGWVFQWCARKNITEWKFRDFKVSEAKYLSESVIQMAHYDGSVYVINMIDDSKYKIPEPTC